MTNHPNRNQYRYFKVCPRGFANENTYYRVHLDEVAEIEKEFQSYDDEHMMEGGYAGWTRDKIARKSGVAINWADRDRY